MRFDRSKIICLDVDGVIAHLQGATLRRYNERWDDDLKPEDITSWEMHAFVKPECGEQIYDIFSEPDLYDEVEVIDGSQEGVERLKSAGYDVIYVSACVVGSVDAKVAWLVRHGFLDSRARCHADFVATSNKSLIDGSMLMDDSLHNIAQWVETRQKRAVLFCAPYNSDGDMIRSMSWSWVRRVYDWPEAVDYFESLLSTRSTELL